MDGKVERDSEGKEVRYPVILSNKEKLIARKVCLAFNQMVCGFDLLRWVILNRTIVLKVRRYETNISSSEPTARASFATSTASASSRIAANTMTTAPRFWAT